MRMTSLVPRSHPRHPARLRRILVGVTLALALALSFQAPTVAHASAKPPPNTFTLSVISAGGGSFKGHGYLMLKNIAPDTIKVFGFGVKAGKVITVGTFGNKGEGKGVYLNLEAYKQFKGTRASLSMNINQNQLVDLVKWVKEHNSWSCPSNCSTFASGAWSLLAPNDKDVSAGFPSTPTNLMNDIKRKSGYKKNIEIPKRAKETVKRLQSDGTLKDASAATLAGSSSGSNSSGLQACFS